MYKNVLGFRRYMLNACLHRADVYNILSKDSERKRICRGREGKEERGRKQEEREDKEKNREGKRKEIEWNETDQRQ